MFALFLSITAAWCGYVWKEREHSQRIHYLMGLLGAFKALTLMSQAIMTMHLEKTGHADGWNIAYYIFTFFRGVLFFTVIVLIGTGWSYMKVGTSACLFDHVAYRLIPFLVLSSAALPGRQGETHPHGRHPSSGDEELRMEEHPSSHHGTRIPTTANS